MSDEPYYRITALGKNEDGKKLASQARVSENLLEFGGALGSWNVAPEAIETFKREFLRSMTALAEKPVSFSSWKLEKFLPVQKVVTEADIANDTEDRFTGLKVGEEYADEILVRGYDTVPFD